MKKILFFLLFLSLSALLFFPGVRSAFGDTNYPPLDGTVRLIYMAVFAFSFLMFGMFLYAENKSDAPVISFNQKMILAGLLSVLFISVVPVFSIDLHCYVMQGRVLGVYGQNPYLVAPSTFPNDPFIEGIFWIHRTVFYGPVWVLLSAIVAFFAGNSEKLNVAFMKVPICLSYLLLIWQSYSISEKILPKKKHVVATFMAFNPFIVCQYLLDGHNDILMIALCITAFNLAYSKKFAASYIFFALSVLTKFITVIVAPMFLYIVFLQVEDLRGKFIEVVKFVMLSILTLLISLSVFLKDGLFFLNLTEHKLFLGSSGLDSNTLPYMWLWILQRVGLLKEMNLFAPAKYLINIFHLIFVATYASVVAIMFKRRVKDALLAFSAAAVVFMCYFTFEAFSFGAWFLVWLLPFLVLSKIRMNITLAYLLSFAGAVAFWKRLSFLIFGVTIVYFLVLLINDKHLKRA